MKSSKYERVLAKAKAMYANSLAGDDEPLTHKTLPATFNHRRARFLKLRDMKHTEKKT